MDEPNEKFLGRTIYSNTKFFSDEFGIVYQKIYAIGFWVIIALFIVSFVGVIINYG